MSKRTKNILTLVLLVSLVFVGLEVAAQCPMCKAAAESNMREGGTSGNGLNRGILYLFFTPFTLAAVFTSIWLWKNRGLKAQRQMEQVQAESYYAESN